MVIPPISSAPESEIAFDQRRLFLLGLDHVRRFSGRTWTDHNAHDPGITTLELAAYALTELSYRASFPVEDVVATKDDGGGLERQFYTPRRILPNCALGAPDYRKLLIDLPGVRNAWLDERPLTLYVDPLERRLTPVRPLVAGLREIQVRGRYGVRLQFEQGLEQAAKQAIVVEARRVLEAQRNLCEAFVAIDEVESQPYSLCAKLELEDTADPNEVLARCFHAVEQYFAPAVHSRTLAEFQRARASGARTLEQAFTGPALEHGFIDDEELEQASLREEIRLSDVIRLWMAISGVQAVRDVRIDALKWNPATGVWEADPAPDPWRIRVPIGRLAVLAPTVRRVQPFKRGVPVRIDEARVLERARVLGSEEVSQQEQLLAEDPPLPRGRFRDLGRYLSFQRDFPELYGLTDHGLSPSVGPEREAQLLQFKAYLLFFDQVMANFSAQLAGVSELFRVDLARRYATTFDAEQRRELLRTRFAQPVGGVRDVEKLYAAGVDQRALADLLEDESTALERRGKLLDHLLARLGEDLRPYVDVLSSVFDTSPLESVLAKARYLEAAPDLAPRRGLGWNQHVAPVWQSENVSGVERRVAHLLGIRNFARRNLSSLPIEVYPELDATPGDEFRFRIFSPATGEILLSSSRKYADVAAAQAAAELALVHARTQERYQRRVDIDGRHYFNLLDTAGHVVARRIEYFLTRQELENSIETIVLALDSSEGMYLIENLQLLPGAEFPLEQWPLLRICAEPGCADCEGDDPYSYRVQVILPAYVGRFTQWEFRQFVETTLRTEMPAHVLPKICWVDQEAMARVEFAYRTWLEARAAAAPDLPTRTSELMDVLATVKNVYPQGSLHDCKSEMELTPFVVGRTALGSIETES